MGRYYHSNGVLEITHMSVQKWGPYQSCNAVHPGQPGSPHHCSTCIIKPPACCCASSNSTFHSEVPEEYPLPGRLQTSYTVGEWYSFNGGGLGHTWNQFECPSEHVSMATFVDALAKAGNCGNCKADIEKCAACLRKMPDDARIKVFHSFFHIDVSD